jgi:hypothetical protein
MAMPPPDAVAAASAAWDDARGVSEVPGGGVIGADRSAIGGVESAPAARLLLVFLAANAAIRLALLPMNTGTYTDGVLQVTQAGEPTALWPPLYGWLVSGLSWLLSPLYSGRAISALAGALGLIPLWALARRAGGQRAAFYAALLYTLAPVSLRWSGRMMSDALFSTLFWAALERWDMAERFTRGRIIGVSGGGPNPEDGTGAERARDADQARRGPSDGALAVATLLTAAATLARYQGVILLPLIVVSWLRALAMFVSNRRNQTGPTGQTEPQSVGFPWRTPLCALALLATPLWVKSQGIAHGQQFAERLGPTLQSATQVILLNAEAFLLLTPYFLVYAVAAWVLFGLIRGAEKPARLLGVSTLYVGLAVLLLQSAFSSFQERYMMPWYGLLWVWGGIGMASAQGLLAKRPRVFSILAAATVVWSAFFSLSVVTLQRHAFGDIADAGRWLRENAPPDATIYSTELYNPDLGGRTIATNKIRFFSGRDVKFLPPPGMPGADAPEPGALICMHSAYPFWTEEMFIRTYRGRRVFEADSEILPLFPDIMEARGTAQNPAAWMHRYAPQHFWTVIWRVDEGRAP